MNQNKLKIIETIDKMQNELLTLSHQIHDHPELGFQEHQAVGFIRIFLSSKKRKACRTENRVSRRI